MGSRAVDERSLQLLEFPRVVETVAALAESPAARARLLASRPLADPAERTLEVARLAEAIRRVVEPGAWRHAGRDDLAVLVDAEAPESEPLDGADLRTVWSWIDAGARTRDGWRDAGVRGRHPALAAIVDALPAAALDPLAARLDAALDADGVVKDSASPVLQRARAAVRDGERVLERQLERWAKGFGEGTYVTRHADRFVALVPAAGFSRRLGIVHDVSSSGQSLFVEPLEMCEANNQLLEQRSVAFEEERRILRELEASVRAETASLLALAEHLVHLDTLGARGRWAAARTAHAIAPAGDTLLLEGARHPLLIDALGETQVVPLDLALGGDTRLLLVSGPNMGGKTVVLKTVGLACALAHAGFPVPAREGSLLPELDTIVVDLGDEQSIAQGLSTFAAHLKTLGAMAAAAGPRTLLLCDEIGSGTDPEEGAPLAQALIEHFVATQAWGVMTTHLGSLKRAAGSMPGVANAAMEFDATGLGPRYRLLPGMPGASRALDMAERLGFDAALLARARVLTPEATRALERLLLDVEGLRARMDEERAGLAEARARAETAERALRETEANSREALAETRRRLTRESDALLARARELWQSVHREARKADKRRDTSERLRDEIGSLEVRRDELAADAERAENALGGIEGESAAAVPLSAGARVQVRDLGVEAEIVSGPDADGRVQLRRGGWTIQSHVSRLLPAARTGAARPAGATPVAPPGVTRGGVNWSVPDDVAPLEVDLRGMDVDEAIRALDAGLDRAVVSSLSELRIIHGLGKGVLRTAVDKHLRDHPQVASQRLGEMREGGRGVTVARLR